MCCKTWTSLNSKATLYGTSRFLKVTANGSDGRKYVYNVHPACIQERFRALSTRIHPSRFETVQNQRVIHFGNLVSWMLFPHWSPWWTQISKIDGMVTRRKENVLSIEFDLFLGMISGDHKGWLQHLVQWLINNRASVISTMDEGKYWLFSVAKWEITLSDRISCMFILLTFGNQLWFFFRASVGNKLWLFNHLRVLLGK